MTRTLIRGGSVVTPAGVEPLDILVEDERIIGLLRGATTARAERTIDAAGQTILPGAIDGHAHFVPQDPAVDHPRHIDNEGFHPGGRAAAAGGVTSIVEMPQAWPATNDGASFRRKRSIAQPEAIVDFAMWGGLVPGARMADAIREQLDAGAASLKAYMCNDDPDLPMVDEADIYQALQILKETGAPLGLHTENEPLLRHFLAKVQATGRTDPLAHAESRPPILEAADVNRAILLAEQTGAWVHIVHMNAIASAELVRRAKARGLRLTAETCPHFLSLDLDDLARLGAFGKCVPALRSREEVDQLWEYMADGTIDCVASDHCGWTISYKQSGGDNIWKSPNGLTGAQTLLPVVITEARARGHSWPQIASWTAGAPARIWRLNPRKGEIRIGAHADLAFVDPERSWELRSGDLLNAQRWSPFEGRTFRGRVVKTMLRGQVIYDDEDPRRVLAEPGYGQFLAPA
jgi:allantoinase